MNPINKTKQISNFLKYSSLVGCLVIIISVFFITPDKKIKEMEINNHSSSNQETSKKETQNYELKINHSVFEGLTQDLLPYKVIANSATKTEDDKYSLKAINAKYILKNGELKIKALEGTMDDASKIIILKDNVEINFEGVTFKSNQIDFNMTSKEAQSNTNVEVDYKDSKIKAKSFNSKDNNKIINFDGNIESRFKISDF